MKLKASRGIEDWIGGITRISCGAFNEPIVGTECSGVFGACRMRSSSVARSPLSPRNDQQETLSNKNECETPKIAALYVETCVGASPSPCSLNRLTETDRSESSSRSGTRLCFPQLAPLHSDAIDRSEEPDHALSCARQTGSALVSTSLLSMRRVMSYDQSQVNEEPLDVSSIVEEETPLGSVVLSPLERTHIHVSGLEKNVWGPPSTPREGGTELSLVQLEGDRLVVERDTLLSADGGNITSSCRDHTDTNDDPAEEVLESASLSAFSDFGHSSLSNTWCATPACSFALDDLTESLSGIFKSLDCGQQSETNERQEDCLTGDVSVPRRGVLDPISSVATAFVCQPGHMHKDISQMERGVVGRRVRNRASRFNAEAHRWQDLRNQMTFAPVRDSNRKKMLFMKTTRSLDSLECPEESLRSFKNRNHAPRERNAMNKLMGSLLPLVSDSENQYGVDEDLFYDSEPEYARATSSRKRPRRVVAERTKNVDTEEPRAAALRARLLTHKAFERQDGNRLDEQQAIELVEFIKSEVLHLLWHRAPTADEPHPRPICVVAFVERGTCLSRNTYVQPKFMWHPAYESSLKSHRLNIAQVSPESRDLISINRIQDSFTIDRAQYPLANKSRSFAIETTSGMLVFEAQSEREKNRVVFGLKLCVARLASLLMVQDERVVQEFFEPADLGVPGQVPQWAAGDSP